MTKLLTTLILLFTTASIALADVRTPIEVVKITDGDTIEAKINKNKFRIRLIDIDCYETSNIHRAYKQAYESKISIEEVIKRGNSSKLFLQRLYASKPKAYLEFQGVDIYGRVLGVVYFNSINVNQKMLKEGGCMIY